MMASVSSKRSRFSICGTRSPSNSTGRLPRPTPTSSRPPLRMSTSASSSARRIGSWNGRMAAARPMRTRLVRMAAAAASTEGETESP